MSQVDWHYQSPDGSSQSMRVAHVLQNHRNCDEMHGVQGIFTVDPVDIRYQFVNESIAMPSAEPESRDLESSNPIRELTEEESQEVQQLSPDRRNRLRKEIEKAHKGMGHPNHDRFLRILRLGGASTAVIALAKSFRCPQCQENVRPKPWRRAAPPRELGFNEV